MERLDGIREFIIGTGGASGGGYTHASHPLDPNKGIRNQIIQSGVLKLPLSPNSDTWNFLTAAGFTLTDSGTSTSLTVAQLEGRCFMVVRI